MLLTAKLHNWKPPKLAHNISLLTPVLMQLSIRFFLIFALIDF